MSVEGRIVGGIDILANLHDMTDGWKTAAWFHFPNSWLSYRKSDGTVAPAAPKNALDRGPDVIAAARKISARDVASWGRKAGGENSCLGCCGQPQSAEQCIKVTGA